MIQMKTNPKDKKHLTKKIFKYVFAILFILCCTTICLYIMLNNKNKVDENSQMDVKDIIIGDMFATYEYIDRDIPIDYFYNLNSNTTYSEIENTIGKPNGARGSGIVEPYYQVGDQYVVIWFSCNEAGEYDKVLNMILYTRDKLIEEIPLK